VNKIQDFDFLDYDNKIKIKNLSIEYCSRLNNFNGIGDYKNLECLTINYSSTESRKKTKLESFYGLEYLLKLKYLKISYYNFNINDLFDKVNNLKYLKKIIIDNKTYENKI
jgi:hypothetical protein